MGRFRLSGLVACTLALAAPAARAADLTRVASSAEEDNLFDLHLSVRWDRSDERMKITREAFDGAATPPLGAVRDEPQLRYARTRNVVVSRLAVGLYHDLELSFEVPYVLADDVSWRFARVNGISAGSLPGNVEDVRVDANGSGTICGTPGACGIFPVGTGTSVFLGGELGDMKLGAAWGILNDRKDDTKPTWIVGLDVTLPSAKRHDPAAGRTWSAAGGLSPHSLDSNRGPVGERVWKFDLSTSLSKRVGPLDPYLRAHVTLMRETNDTYSNCEAAATLGGPAINPAQMNWSAPANCASSRWKDEAAAKLPVVAGLLFGTELVPYEDVREGQKVALDLRLAADWTSSARWYNPLTFATGKLLWTEEHVTASARAALLLQASPYFTVIGSASITTQTPHFLTGEPLGEERGGVPAGPLTGAPGDPPNPNLNPNFDWRYDAPGRRFRATEVSVFTFGASALIQF
jgi:hypothetical protein